VSSLSRQVHLFTLEEDEAFLVKDNSTGVVWSIPLVLYTAS
jgi:hypothetical protein